jgi:hypothetical protein
MEVAAMNNQNEQNRNDVEEVKAGDLKASDFFPPGVGWNQAGGGEDDEEEIRRRERDGLAERH